jgi:hypothetical protein
VLQAQELRQIAAGFSTSPMNMEKARTLTHASDVGDSSDVWTSEEKPIVPIDS